MFLYMQNYIYGLPQPHECAAHVAYLHGDDAFVSFGGDAVCGGVRRYGDGFQQCSCGGIEAAGDGCGVVSAEGDDDGASVSGGPCRCVVQVCGGEAFHVGDVEYLHQAFVGIYLAVAVVVVGVG